MQRGVIFAAAILMASAGLTYADGEIVASLAPSSDAAVAKLPLRPAVLTLANKSPQTIRTIAMRDSVGGPAFFVECNLPAGSEGKFTVQLPPISQQQTYDIHPLASTDAAIPSTKATIDWPGDVIDPLAMVDTRTCRQWESSVAYWPGEIKRRLATVIAAFAMICCLTIILRKNSARAVAIIIAAIIAGGSIVMILRNQPTVNQIAIAPDSPGGEKMLVLSSLRQTEWISPADGGYYLPLYVSRGQLMRDMSEIHPDGKLRLHLTPGIVRIVTRYDLGPSSAGLRKSPETSSSGS